MKFFRTNLPEGKIALRAWRMAVVGQLLQFEVEASIENKPVAARQIV